MFHATFSIHTGPEVTVDDEKIYPKKDWQMPTHNTFCIFIALAIMHLLFPTPQSVYNFIKMLIFCYVVWFALFLMSSVLLILALYCMYLFRTSRMS